MHRDLDRTAGGLEVEAAPVDAGRGLAAADSRSELRIPVPAIAAIWVQPEVLRKAGEVGAAGAMRQVGGDGVGRLFKAGEAGLDVLAHEAEDLRRAPWVGPGDDVDQRQRAE